MAFFEQEDVRDPVVVARERIHLLHRQDGLPEMAVGLTLLFASAMNWAEHYFRSGWIGGTGQMIFSLSFVLMCLSEVRVVRWIRCRYLLDRVGYVEMRPSVGEKRRERRAIFAALLVVVGIAALAILARPAQWDGWILCGLGIVFGVVTVMLGGEVRTRIYGALSVALGVWLSMAGTPVAKGLWIFFSLVGALHLISGTVVLILFLRKPVEADAA